MPSPTSSLATLRPDLAGALMEFNLAADRQGFIGHRVFPVLEVAMQAGPFGKISINELLQARDTKRAPGGGYNRGKFKFTTDSYACEEYGLEEPVDDRQARMYANYIDAEMISAQRAFDGVLREAEKRIAAAVFNATTWAAHTGAVTNEWDDPDNATPIDDVQTACRAVLSASGLWPNALVINRSVFQNLRKCDQIVAAIVASGAGQAAKQSDITAQLIAQCFDLPYVIVAGGCKNTANEGQAISISDIWSGEYAMVCTIATDNDISNPCIGRTFHWSDDGSQVGGTVETYRDETTRSDIVRVRHDVDEKVLHVESSYLLSNITT